jgi:HSP20 family protein
MFSKDDKFPKLDKKMLNEWMETFVREPFHRIIENKSFRVDLYETDRQCVIQAELPGFDRDQIEIEVLHSAVKITAHHSELSEETNEQEQYYRKERSFESLERIIPVPFEIDESKTTAQYRKGLLTITVPNDGENRKKRTIDIE